MSEDPEKKGDDPGEAPREPPSDPYESGGGSLLRGCGTALAVAFLVLAFVVGACFMSF